MVPFGIRAFLLGIILITVFGCEQDASLPADAVIANFDFQFQLLNENGVPATTFHQGENFVFSLLIINRSDQFWSLQQRLDDQSNFFRVYRVKSNSIKAKVKEIDMGRPWKTMFCTFQLGTLILPHDALKLEIPWMPQPWEVSNPHYNGHFCLVEKNDPLNPGKYITSFSSAFYFSQNDRCYTTKEKPFNIEFEIK